MLTVVTDYERPDTGSPDRAPERRPRRRWEPSTWVVALLCFVPLAVAAVVALLH